MFIMFIIIIIIKSKLKQKVKILWVVYSFMTKTWPVGRFGNPPGPFLI